MIIGFNVQIPFASDNMILDLLGKSIIQSHDWILRDIEGVSNEKKHEKEYKDVGIYSDLIISGNCLFSIIEYNKYSLFSAIMIGFPANNLIQSTNIATFDDFESSSADIMLIITDTFCIELYSKYSANLHIIIQNLQNLFPNQSFEYITDSNNPRVKLHTY